MSHHGDAVGEVAAIVLRAVIRMAVYRVIGPLPLGLVVVLGVVAAVALVKLRSARQPSTRHERR